MFDFKKTVEDLLLEFKYSTMIIEASASNVEEPLKLSEYIKKINNELNKPPLPLDDTLIQKYGDSGINRAKGTSFRKTAAQAKLEEPYYPLIDLFYALYIYTENNAKKNKDIDKDKLSALDYMNDTLPEMANRISDGSKGNFNKKIELFSKKPFNTYTETDYVYKKYYLDIENLSELTIEQYSNDTIYNGVLKIAKIKADSIYEKFKSENYASKVLLYPLDFSTGKKMQMPDNDLLTCSSIILGWYKDTITTSGANTIPDPKTNNPITIDITKIGTSAGANTVFGIDYNDFLNGKSKYILDKSDPTKLPFPVLITNIASCKVSAPEIYRAITNYCVSVKPKKTGVDKMALAKDIVGDIRAVGRKNIYG